MRLMIRSKLGKRLAAFLCAALILFYSVAFPVQKAEAVSLPVVAGSALVGVAIGYAVTAYLNASGIFLFDADKVGFSTWVSANLQDLIAMYNATSPAVPITPSLKVFALGATLIYPQKIWNALSSFVSWMIGHFSITDNQTGVEKEIIDFELMKYYSFPTPPTVSTIKNMTRVYSAPLQYPYSSLDTYVCNTSTDVQFYPCIVKNLSSGSNTYKSVVAFIYTPYGSSPTFRVATIRNYQNGTEEYRTGTFSLSPYKFVSVPNGTAYYTNYNLALSSAVGEFHAYPIFDTLAQAAQYYIAYVTGSFSGTSAVYDTTAVTELPTTTDEYVGLTVSGLDPAVTLEQLQTAIADSVVERLKTEVKPVTVTVEQGTTVDSETGEITGDITIAAPEAETIPSVEALAAPKEFLETMVEAVQTKFPFCLVFDVFNIIKAFDTGPVAPKIVLNFTDPFSKGQYNITVDLAPWDDVAAVVRQLEQMVLFLGFWLNFDKFNVLNIILGQLG